MAKDDVGKETWLPGAATVLAIVSCYGTAAAVTLLSLLGISIAIDERAWAGAIMVFAALASAAIVASCRRHRQAGPAMLAGLSLALIASAMYGAYGRVIELAGFALLAGAAAWDWKARTSRKDAGAGTSWIAAETLAARLHEQPRPIVVDVRGRDEFVGELGHLHCAQNVPLGDLPRLIVELARFKEREMIV